MVSSEYMVNVFKSPYFMPLAIVIGAALIAGALLYTDGFKSNDLTLQEAGDRAISFINENIEEDVTASLIDMADVGSGIYKIHLKINGTGDEYDSYITKDGNFLFPTGADLKEWQAAAPAEETSQRDKPDVKLFVMSYCPYGLQAEKMFLPVYDLLKDKVDMGIYFVNYIMHGKKEIDENLTQYCIQKEEKEKYDEYLACFTAGGDTAQCADEAGVDEGKLNSCITQTDQQFNITQLYNDQTTWLNGNYPKFNVNDDLNKKYGVQGSPTIVINDQVVNVSPRSPEKFKEVVCQAFKSAPAECSQALSSDSPSPGVGTGTSLTSGGGCAQ